ncbi:hypothetical protein BVG80_02505 [Sphingobacteriales bacterium TSM_CSM]|nr:hypothetical protein BVG80_02505 [Sphingobacteriales bacterium TSM_CSM]
MFQNCTHKPAISKQKNDCKLQFRHLLVRQIPFARLILQGKIAAQLLWGFAQAYLGEINGIFAPK